MINRKLQLTIREQQLLRHIAKGGTTREFADIHCIAVKTADTHRYNLMKQIECHNAAECTMYAIRFGFIKVGESP